MTSTIDIKINRPKVTSNALTTSAPFVRSARTKITYLLSVGMQIKPAKIKHTNTDTIEIIPEKIIGILLWPKLPSAAITPIERNPLPAMKTPSTLDGACLRTHAGACLFHCAINSSFRPEIKTLHMKLEIKTLHMLYYSEKLSVISLILSTI